MKVTAILTMERIEESVQFWTGKAGFDLTVSIPQGDAMGFAILQKGDAEVMLQSHDSVAADLPMLTGYAGASKSCLFVEVEDFEGMVQKLEGVPVAFPVRQTTYGMREIGVFEPGGHLVIFARPN
ncbi:MAG: hypothetical protein U0R19_31720 [Bryobacteraceae bacterium]